MSREFQEHLFESFTREETSTVSGIQGTGLGMAINVSHMVQEIAMELLSNAGFSVSLADDGDVAVETLRTAAPDQFDLVLMDIQMPKLDGLSATRLIRQTPGYEFTPILAMTANAFTEDRRYCLEAGMSDFLTKPFNPDVLFGILLRWLEDSLPAPLDHGL